MTWVELLAQSAWRGSIILAAGFAAAAGLRRASAAVRHFVWTAALAAMVVLPVALLVAPKWSWRVERAEPVRAAVVVSQRVEPIKENTGGKTTGATTDWIVGLWMLGCAVVGARYSLGAGRASRMAPRAAEARHADAMLEELRRGLGIRRRVRVLESADAPMPLTWGILRPVVLLPEGSGQWPPARLRSVLLHELVHVERLDLLAQAIAQAACCLYWFHPLAWMAARQLREERERACDDAVLSRGVAAPDYAGHLMELVRAMGAARGRWRDAPAMAEASGLESRVRALLDGTRSRYPLSRRAAIAIASAAAAVLLPMAAITAQAQAQAARGSLVGVVEDQSHARVPNCQVTARNLDGPNQEVTRANEAGEYSFAAIPPGRYTLEFRSAGFKILKRDMLVVEAGKVARTNATLEVGEVSETVVIVGQKSATVAPATGWPQRIRVGGNVQATKVVRMARPEYPAELQQLGIQGTVVMRAVISTTGDLLNLEAINADVDARLVKTALDAVRLWKYQPTLLNGQPVEVATTITVDFQLGQ